MDLITVTFSTPLFVFMLAFCICLAFVCGCIWMAGGRNKRKIELTAFKGGLLDQEAHEHVI